MFYLFWYASFFHFVKKVTIDTNPTPLGVRFLQNAARFVSHGPALILVAAPFRFNFTCRFNFPFLNLFLFLPRRELNR
jgi:hypothetical protein